MAYFSKRIKPSLDCFVEEVAFMITAILHHVWYRFCRRERIANMHRLRSSMRDIWTRRRSISKQIGLLHPTYVACLAPKTH